MTRPPTQYGCATEEEINALRLTPEERQGVVDWLLNSQSLYHLVRIEEYRVPCHMIFGVPFGMRGRLDTEPVFLKFERERLGFDRGGRIYNIAMAICHQTGEMVCCPKTEFHEKEIPSIQDRVEQLRRHQKRY